MAEKSRREFIECGACALFMLGCGGEKIEAVDSGGGATDTLTDTEVPFDPCTVTPEANWTQINLSSYPDLYQVGNSVTTNINGRSMVIAHVSEGCYAAVSSSCTHQGGEIYFNVSRNQFSCRLHAATFELDGQWSLGQIATNLQSFLCAREGTTLWIQV